jgi:hypothetical protein
MLPWKELGPSVDLRAAGAHDQVDPREGDHALRVGASGRQIKGRPKAAFPYVPSVIIAARPLR